MEKYLDERAAAEMIACSTALMRKWRLNGEGPNYHKIGRLVRYAPADIQAYMDAQRVQTGGGR
jgi:hypothetical protein